jgi:drug/metabolite transporter (DMT)-like permease
VNTDQSNIGGKLVVQDRTTIGVVSLCLGIFIFSFQDAILKYVSDTYPVTQVVAIRSLIAVPILACMVHFESGLGALRTGQAGWLALRACAMFTSYLAFYLAFPALPLAEAVALFFAAPLFITVLAAPVLGEHVGWRSWAAILIGLIGVLVILRPGSALFEPAALLSLLAALLYAAAALMTRRLGNTDTALTMTFYAMGIYLIGAAVLGLVLHLAGFSTATHPSLQFLVRPWVWPTVTDFVLMGACGVIATVAMTLLTHAYRIAEANVVTSFEYSGVFWPSLWGFLFFAELPRWTTFLGAVLIVGSGLLVLNRNGKRITPAAAN